MTDQFSLFGGGESPAPLNPPCRAPAAPVPSPPPAPPPPAHPPVPQHELLGARLRTAGLPRDCRITVHANRTTVLRFHLTRGLRIHLGFIHASDEVLQAIVKWCRPGLRRRERVALQAKFGDFPVHQHLPPREPGRRAERVRPGDQPVLDRLTACHARFSREHFGGELPPIPIRLSSRMRQKLGEFRADRVTGRALEITISRQHLARDGWAAVEHTLLHEMVHQWQAETGRPLDHGAEFRRKARAVGIRARASTPLDDLMRCGPGLKPGLGACGDPS